MGPHALPAATCWAVTRWSDPSARRRLRAVERVAHPTYTIPTWSFSLPNRMRRNQVCGQKQRSTEVPSTPPTALEKGAATSRLASCEKPFVGKIKNARLEQQPHPFPFHIVYPCYIVCRLRSPVSAGSAFVAGMRLHLLEGVWSAVLSRGTTCFLWW